VRTTSASKTCITIDGRREGKFQARDQDQAADQVLADQDQVVDRGVTDQDRVVDGGATDQD